MEVTDKFDAKKYVNSLRRIDNFMSEDTTLGAPLRRGLKNLEIPEAVNDRKIVAMTIYKDRLFLATERGLYEKLGEILCRVKFEDEQLPPTSSGEVCNYKRCSRIPFIASTYMGHCQACGNQYDSTYDYKIKKQEIDSGK